MQSLAQYIRNPQWPRQQKWREAIWQAMGNVGLTGLHAWPLHRSWVEFACVPMPIRHLPEGLVGKVIVQVSDLHYSPVVGGKYLSQYMEWINEISPALVVATGDLFMGGKRYADKVAKLLASIKTSHGVLAIMGNHDYGVDGKALGSRGLRRAEYLEHAMDAHGITMLRNEAWQMKTPGQPGSLTFVGLDEHWAGQMKPEIAFAGIGEKEPVICLAHNPACCLSLMSYPWQWMLSGHTHGRQLAGSPLGQRLYPTKYRHFTHGLYRVNGRYLYVNRGLCYGQRARQSCRPEITAFELRAAGRETKVEKPFKLIF